MDENMFDLGLDVATISADLPDPVITLSGADNYTVQGTADYPLLALSVYGKSVQDGTPTPDAPIDIVNVGDDGNVKITSRGKNIFDFNAWKNNITYVADATYTIIDNGINVIVKSTIPTGDGRVNTGYLIDVTPGKKYTLSMDTATNQGYAVVYGNNNSDIAKLYATGTRDYLTFNVPSDVTQVRILLRFDRANETNTFSNFQLEEGSVATAYVPYGNTATITSGLPLCSVGNVRDELIYNADGTGKIIKRVRSTELSGNEEWDSAYSVELQAYAFKCTMHGAYKNPQYPGGIGLCSHYIFNSKGNDVAYSVRFTTGSDNIIWFYAMDYDTVDDWMSYLSENPVTVLYQLATPQEIELSADEMAELQKLQSYEGTTSIYNNEQAEMLVKMLRSDYDMKYIEWLKESQTWTCPKAGKWKVICVGGGASGGSGGNAIIPTAAGGTTSFGSIVSASGAPSTKDYIKTSSPIDNIWVGAYGGYTGVNYGGTPAMAMNAGDNFGVSGAHTNGTLPSNFNPVCGIGYGAGGASAAQEAPIPGRAGSIESTIVDLEEGQTIMCTVGKGGQTTDATTMSSGADGVIVVQYLGY